MESTTAKPSPLECQLGEAEREKDSSEADAANIQPAMKPLPCTSNISDRKGLHNLHTAQSQPSIATNQTQMNPFYPGVFNPPSYTVPGARFH